MHTILGIAREAATEADRAITLFPPHSSLHESLGIIEEEFDEFRKEVFSFNLAKGRDTRPGARKELIQIAAMAIRAIHDLKL